MDAVTHDLRIYEAQQEKRARKEDAYNEAKEEYLYNELFEKDGAELVDLEITLLIAYAISALNAALSLGDRMNLVDVKSRAIAVLDAIRYSSIINDKANDYALTQIEE